MTAKILVHLATLLNQWDTLLADVANKLEYTNEPILVDYYMRMMPEMQSARSYLAAALTYETTNCNEPLL
jgi:hypothetical protein